MRKSIYKAGVIVAGMVLGTGLAIADDAFETLQKSDGVVYRHVASDAKVSEGEIVSIRLDTAKVEGNEENAVDFKLSVTLGGSSEKLEASGQCRADEGQMDCRVSCDGSGFYLMGQDKKTILLMNPEGFQMNGCRKDTKKPQTIKASREGSVYDLVLVTK